jgi:sec-independent protein translocase protein TatC
MSTSRDTLPDPDDFFAETRMSFGDHIEDLRSHLIRALLGFGIALLASFCVGHLVLEFISYPIVKELKVYYEERMDKAKDKYLAKLQEEGNAATEKGFVKVRRDAFEKLFGAVKAPEYLSSDGQFVQLPTIRDPKADIEDWIRKYRELTPEPTLKSFTIMETVLVWFKVCIITALVLGSPWIFYQIWSFIAAGLYPQEKKLVNHYLPFSIFLFLAGVMLCQFVVMPQTIAALLWFNHWLGVEPELRLNDWLNFALLLPILFGISFQTPLAMLTLERIGLTTVETYRKKRLMFLFVMMIVFAILSPTPDPFVTPTVFFACMWGLYELGIWLCKLSPRQALPDLDVPESEEMIEV